MHRDPKEWARVRRLILMDGASIRGIARREHLSRNTVRKMLTLPEPPPSARIGRASRLGPHVSAIKRRLAEAERLPPSVKPSIVELFRQLRDEDGYDASYSALRDHLHGVADRSSCVWELAYDLVCALDRRRAIDFLFHLAQPATSLLSTSTAAVVLQDTARVVTIVPKPTKRQRDRDRAFEWLRAVGSGEIGWRTLLRDLAHVPNLRELLDRLATGSLTHRKRCLMILGAEAGLQIQAVQDCLGLSRASQRRYRRLFRDGGAAALFSRKAKPQKRHDKELKAAVFRLLHEPPSNYGINRTSWRIADLCEQLREVGTPACQHVVSQIVRDAGYKWRKARVVLTSTDPAYSEKLAYVQATLSRLQPDEAFFSIDEFGPFAIRTRGGSALTALGADRTVPQWQPSRGCLIMTAALELSGNQVTHFYSAKKNTAEMIRMMDALVARYADRRRLYLSWDAASWHISKALQAYIEAHNAAVAERGGPTVETAPLPAGAQFLNVIESVFSGLARAVIHNSDYQSTDEAKAAIDCYFEKRNAHFREHPRRAGRKIWGMERGPAVFLDAGTFKDPAYR